MGDTGEEGDIMPSIGKVTFASGQASKRLELTVMADKVSTESQIYLFKSSSSSYSQLVVGSLRQTLFSQVVPSADGSFFATTIFRWYHHYM